MFMDDSLNILNLKIEHTNKFIKINNLKTHFC